MIDPDGVGPNLFLDLLVKAGVPIAAVGVLGALIAGWQILTKADEKAHAVEARADSALGKAPIVVRAYVLYVGSHLVTIILTLAIASTLFTDRRVLGLIGVTSATAITRVTAGVTAYFLALDWWSLTQGDEVPDLVSSLVGLMGGCGLLLYAAYNSFSTGNWTTLIPWALAVAAWFRALTWSSARASALARALQFKY